MVARSPIRRSLVPSSAVRPEIEDFDVVVSGIASYVKVASAIDDEMVLGSLVGALEFAADLGTPGAG